jgi:hypothetical protein
MTGWTLSGQYLNFGIFILGMLMTGLGGLQSWDALPHAITPAGVSGFVIACLGYLRSINTERPRDSFQERRNDPPKPEEKK